MSILEIKNIKKSFGEDLEVLQDISLAVEEGEVVSILGPSGSGKSTLLRCATFLEQIDSGSIAYGGKVYVENDAAGNAKKPERAKILEAQSNFGLVFQDFNLFPHFSVLKNVMDAPVKNQKRPKQEAEKEARALLAKMGLEGKEDAYPCELSGGQKQRVAIARALALRPKMLYFDEPTSALTFKEVESLFKVVKDLKAQGIGIIYITHRLDEVFEISTDVGIMRDGRITLMGKIEEFTKAALVKGLLPDATDQQEIVNKNTVDYSKDPVLELKNYSGYGFKDISLKVYPGEILGVAGVVGAFLGSIIGVICIIIIGELGYVAAISGVVMAICVLKGYEVLGGKASKKGIVISVIIMLVMTWVGDRLDWAIIIYKELSQYADVNITIFDCYRMIPDMLSEGYMDMSNYITNLVMIYAFLLLGMIPTVKGFINDKKNENRMIRIGGANSTVTTETNSENIE